MAVSLALWTQHRQSLVDLIIEGSISQEADVFRGLIFDSQSVDIVGLRGCKNVALCSVDNRRTGRAITQGRQSGVFGR